ncbi:MAG: SDR family oxidoreductase [Actinomycetota bacterium]
MELGLKGRVALVAASSRGLGRACAVAFAREGADVAICARGRDDLRSAEAELVELGVRVHATVADISISDDCRRFVQGAADALGRVDILVNNNGGPPSGAFDSFTEDDYRSAVELNLLSTIRCTMGAVPLMRRGGWGRVVNITSIAAKQPLEGLVLSNTTRVGVIGFAKTLATALAREGITVNTVCPGPTLTDRIRDLAQQRADREQISVQEALGAYVPDIPMGRLGKPEELAALVIFLASEPAAFITGTTIQVDGGMLRALM